MNVIKKFKVTETKKGFTLIELVVVIAILAVLALILIPSITGYVNKANTAKNQANARSIYTTAILVEQKTPFVGDEGNGNELKFAKNFKPAAAREIPFKKEVFDMVGKISESYKITKTPSGFIVEVGGSATQGGVQFPE